VPPPPDAHAASLPTGPPIAPRRSLKRTVSATIAERGYFGLTILAGLIAIVAIAYFLWKLIAQTGPVWNTFGVWGFISGTQWIVSPAVGNPVYGALPMIYGTLVTGAIAMLIAIPLSIGVALATTIFLPRRTRAPLAGLIDLLAAVPSVVYGLWGIVVMVPAINPFLTSVSSHQMATVFVVALLVGAVARILPGSLRIIGYVISAFLLISWFLALTGVIGRSFRLLDGPVLSGSYLAAGLVLAVMVLPIITAITREVIVTVPREQQEAAYALGATRWEMVRDSVLPWSRSGIVLGNTPNILGSLLGPGATLASKIALELGEATGLQLNSLCALGVVLFVLALLTNLLARLVTRRRTGSGDGFVHRLLARATLRPVIATADIELADAEELAEAPPTVPPRRREAGLPQLSSTRRRQSMLATGAIYLAVALALIPLGLVIGEIVVQGVQVLSIDFFTKLPPINPNDTAGAGISNAIVGTAIMVGVATLIAAPLGILTSLLMYECSLSGRLGIRLGRVLGLFIDILLGVPSIVVGLIVYLAIVVEQQQFDALTGAIALSIIMFPIVVRTADEVLRLVPNGLSEAALALGAPKWRTALTIVVPAALPGILTGIVLAIARAAGETAPLLFTAGASNFMSTSLTQPIAAIPEVIYNFTINERTAQSTQFAWGATLVLVAMILVLNLTARLLGRLAHGTER
jgi:phosphate transport system permease protein